MSKKDLDPLNEYRQFLSQYTNARVALGHTGGHLRIRDWLDFQKGFVQAKDALSSELDTRAISEWCRQNNLESLELYSQANKLEHFLMRPDLGRVLSPDSETKLQALNDNARNKDILILLSGGLSPTAIQHHAPGFLTHMIKYLQTEKWSLAPLVILPRSRVALGDVINFHLQAQIVVMLIGERPGLSTPDSMGIYVTYGARPGCRDSERNCISNIHGAGLSYEEAAAKLMQLLKLARQQKCTGITKMPVIVP